MTHALWCGYARLCSISITMSKMLGFVNFKHLVTIYTSRTFYLMIDGNVFNTYEYISSHYLHQISVPHSIFGPYYYNQDEKIYKGNTTVQPLSPSPYCWPIPHRRLPEQVGSTSALKRSITIEIPERGHEITDLEHKESTVIWICNKVGIWG